ncbi:MAG: hypothetical protein ACI97A_003899 [Planctomycetota bacterium]|jgi:hypothetical protein
MASRRPANRQRKGGSSRKQKEPELNARQQMDKSDNKMAMQVLGACVVGAIVIFGLMSLSDDTPIKKKEPRRAPVEIEGDTRQAPEEESEVPIWLAEQFMIALANEDEDAVSKLIAWDLLFAKIEHLNNRSEEEKYVNLDPDAQMTLRDKLLIKILDPDFAQLIRENSLELLNSGNFIWNTSDVGIDYGNVTMMVQDSRGRDKLLLQVKSQLKKGKDTVKDAKNKEAWGIVDVSNQVMGKISPDGAKIRMRNKSITENIFKKKRKPRKKSTAGPPEADPKLVDWPEGMGDSTKSKIESEVAALMQTEDFRKADQGKFSLIDRAKPAITGLLRALSQLDFEEDKDEVAKAFQVVQVLREITGLNFNFRPMATRQGFGMGGMTRATPEERTKAVRRWFGWWEKNGKSWTKKAEVIEPESWDDLVEDEDKDKTKKK